MCAYCGNQLTKRSQKKFCSSSCAAKFNNVQYPKRPHGPWSSKPCLYCGKVTNKIKYCSQECSGADRRFDLIFKSIEIGILPNSPKTAKEHLKLFYGAVCNICKLSEWLGKPILLILDHINGNSDNWGIDNLRLVCSNCDAQLPTYKHKNKGNGRFNRAQRYKAGLSY